MNLNKKIYKLTVGLIFSQSIILQLSQIALGQTTQFIDVNSHWAQSCIDNLAEKNIIGGDQEQQRFRPDDPITRVEFAIILTEAFPDVKPVQEPIEFVDIPSDYWAYSAIREANRRGFLSSYIAGVFNPTSEVTRVQVLEALVQGLNYQAESVSIQQLPAIFEDANEISETTQTAITAATENWLVVNYPNVRQLNPNQTATRAEVAAMVCQALAKPQQIALIPSQYIARVSIDEVPQQIAETPSTPPENTETESQPEIEETEAESTVTATEATDISAVESDSNTPSTDNIENQIEIGESQTVKVQLFYETPQVLQLTIIRKGEERLSESIALSSSVNQENLDKVTDIKIIDLDNDDEAEVLIDFVGRDSVNRPLYYSLIYRYSSFAREYRDIKQTWGMLPYQIQNSNPNDIPIFISFDYRFSQNYNSETAEHLPLQVWQYQSGEMQDKTLFYPDIVQKQTAILWLELNQSAQLEENLQGIIAAYVANKSVLGEAEEGWQRVQEIYQGSDAAGFFNELRQFLRETGYLE
ncbi:MAG: S-layer homology domain-containing protein [Microcoleaceae cyanobacterium]